MWIKMDILINSELHHQSGHYYTYDILYDRYVILGMSDHEVQWLCKHLGHSTKVHQLHYRQMSGYTERVNLGKLMLMQDFNTLSKFKGMKIEDININDIIMEADNHVTNFDEDKENCAPTSDIEEAGEQDILEPTFGRAKFTRVTWSKVEVEELNSLFRSFLDKGVCPRMDDRNKAKAISKQMMDTSIQEIGKLLRRSFGEC